MKQIICLAWGILISSAYYPNGAQLGAGEINQLSQLPAGSGCFKTRTEKAQSSDIENSNDTIQLTTQSSHPCGHFKLPDEIARDHYGGTESGDGKYSAGHINYYLLQQGVLFLRYCEQTCHETLRKIQKYNVCMK